MKKLLQLRNFPALAAAFALAAGTCSISAATIVIDGTTPGYVNDGSFEAGSDGSPVAWLGSDTSSNLAADLSIERIATYRNSVGSSVADGSQYIVIAGPGAPATYGVYLDTGYDFTLGETFDFSFAYSWHQFNGDPALRDIDYQLFTTTTNDDSGTVETVLASGSVTATTSLQTESISSSFTSGASGERLFVAFTPTTEDSGNYFAVDEVNLTVVPEPSSFALLAGCFGLTWVMLRRRG